MRVSSLRVSRDVGKMGYKRYLWVTKRIYRCLVLLGITELASCYDLDFWSLVVCVSLMFSPHLFVIHLVFISHVSILFMLVLIHWIGSCHVRCSVMFVLTVVHPGPFIVLVGQQLVSSGFLMN